MAGVLRVMPGARARGRLSAGRGVRLAGCTRGRAANEPWPEPGLVGQVLMHADATRRLDESGAPVEGVPPRHAPVAYRRIRRAPAVSVRDSGALGYWAGA